MARLLVLVDTQSVVSEVSLSIAARCAECPTFDWRVLARWSHQQMGDRYQTMLARSWSPPSSVWSQRYGLEALRQANFHPLASDRLSDAGVRHPIVRYYKQQVKQGNVGKIIVVSHDARAVLAPLMELRREPAYREIEIVVVCLKDRCTLACREDRRGRIALVELSDLQAGGWPFVSPFPDPVAPAGSGRLKIGWSRPRAGRSTFRVEQPVAHRFFREQGGAFLLASRWGSPNRRLAA